MKLDEAASSPHLLCKVILQKQNNDYVPSSKFRLYVNRSNYMCYGILNIGLFAGKYCWKVSPSLKYGGDWKAGIDKIGFLKQNGKFELPDATTIQLVKNPIEYGSNIIFYLDLESDTKNLSIKVNEVNYDKIVMDNNHGMMWDHVALYPVIYIWVNQINDKNQCDCTFDFDPIESHSVFNQQYKSYNELSWENSSKYFKLNTGSNADHMKK